MTYDTAVNPTGTLGILVQGVAHTFGDAGSSLLATGATTTATYQTKDIWDNYGTPMYLSAFYRMASSGATNTTVCDMLSQSGGVTDTQIILQVQYNTTGGAHYGFVMEPAESGSSAVSSVHLSLDTDYWIQLHIAGVNERYHQLLIYSKSGTWSLLNTLNYDHLCTNGSHALCTTPTAQATPTGTASSGSTALTVSSGTGIATGQVVIGAGIPTRARAATPHGPW